MIPYGMSVTLVEPQYPVNVGHVARLLKNFGVRKLYLVRPRVDISVASVYASHASELLDEAELTSLESVRRTNELLIATTAVRAARKSNVIRRPVPPDALRRLIESSRSSSLVFGRDSTGLTNDEIAMCDVTTSIDVGTKYRALNLGHAVAIVLYAVSRGDRTGRGTQSRKAREVFVENFYRLSTASNVQAHRLKSLEVATRRVVSESGLTDRQLNLFSGTFARASAIIEGRQEVDSKT